MLKAVIFDLDDTLLDWRTQSIDWMDYNRIHIRYVIEYVTDIIGTNSVDERDLLQTVNSLTRSSWENARETMQAPHLGNIIYDALASLSITHPAITVDSLIDAYQWRGMPGVEPFPEVPSVLQTFRDYGLRIGLVTNAFQPMRSRKVELADYGLVDFFDSMISAADAGIIKPARAIFERSLQELSVTAEEAVFIGDSREADIFGAQNIGMKAILRRRIDDTALLHHKIKPDAEITELGQLFNILDKFFPEWRTED